MRNAVLVQRLGHQRPWPGACDGLLLVQQALAPGQWASSGMADFQDTQPLHLSPEKGDPHTGLLVPGQAISHVLGQCGPVPARLMRWARRSSGFLSVRPLYPLTHALHAS
jgi:hypothetical protein